MTFMAEILFGCITSSWKISPITDHKELHQYQHQVCHIEKTATCEQTDLKLALSSSLYEIIPLEYTTSAKCMSRPCMLLTCLPLTFTPNRG